MKSILLTIIVTITFSALASDFPKVDSDLASYDSKIKFMREDFLKIPSNEHDKEWVKRKLAFMVEIDQFMRSFNQTPFKNKYSEDEIKYFNANYFERFKELDTSNTTDLKELLKIYHWFTISEFGSEADNNAWLIVQHADLDRAFQKEILSILEKLLPKQETKPANYAYLFDRVAASWNNESERTLQRYGTQGRCIGQGTWEEIPSEDTDNLNQRRADVGLGTMEEYKIAFKDICK